MRDDTAMAAARGGVGGGGGGGGGDGPEEMVAAWEAADLAMVAVAVRAPVTLH